MHTLYEIISDYCAANGLIIPNSRQINHISSAIIEQIRTGGKESLIRKKEIKQPMIVNVYPAKIRPLIEQVLKDYFTDRPAFIAARSHVAGIKNLLYCVEIHKSEAFEKALIKLKFPVKRNEGFSGKYQYQYVIPVLKNLASLVSLGKEFQRQRWEQENRIAIERWRERVKLRKNSGSQN